MKNLSKYIVFFIFLIVFVTHLAAEAITAQEKVKKIENGKVIIENPKLEQKGKEIEYIKNKEKFYSDAFMPNTNVAIPSNLQGTTLKQESLDILSSPVESAALKFKEKEQDELQVRESAPENNKAFVITGQGGIKIDEKAHTLIALNNIVINYKELIIKTNELFASYINLDGVQQNLKNHSFINFKRIEARNSIEIMTAKGKIIGDYYIYDVAKKVMIIKSDGKPSTYEDDKILVVAQDRFEFQEEKNLALILGYPIIEIKRKLIIKEKSPEPNENVKQNNDIFDNKNYKMFADLISINLHEDRRQIKYAEAFDKIMLIFDDQKQGKTTVTGEYAYYDNKINKITIEDNVVINNSRGVLKGCKIIINIESGEVNLISCKDHKQFESTIQIQ